MTLPDGKIRKGIPSEGTARANTPVKIPVVFRERPTGEQACGVWNSGPHSLASSVFRRGHMVHFQPLRCQGKSWLGVGGKRARGGHLGKSSLLLNRVTRKGGFSLPAFEQCW